MALTIPFIWKQIFETSQFCFYLLLLHSMFWLMKLRNMKTHIKNESKPVNILKSSLKAICGYIYHKTKQAESKIGQCLAKACMCCLCLFEKCLRYFNATSYTMVAITGHVSVFFVWGMIISIEQNRNDVGWSLRDLIYVCLLL